MTKTDQEDIAILRPCDQLALIACEGGLPYGRDSLAPKRLLAGGFVKKSSWSLTKKGEEAALFLRRGSHK
jgi:hypothetical protein